MKDIFKKMKKDSGSMIVTGIGLGVGSQAVGSVGGAGSADTQKAIGKISSSMPTMSGIMTAGYMLDATKKMSKKKF